MKLKLGADPELKWRSSHKRRTVARMKLYCYSDFITPAWAKNPEHWRQLTGLDKHALRTAHGNWPAPRGWHKPNGVLANDAIEKIGSGLL